MKTRLFLQVTTIMIFIVVTTGCRSSRTNRRHYPTYSSRTNLPPGQEKKIYGQRSARPFAPGQRKKYDDHDFDDNRHGNKHHKNHKKG